MTERRTREHDGSAYPASPRPDRSAQLEQGRPGSDDVVDEHDLAVERAPDAERAVDVAAALEPAEADLIEHETPPAGGRTRPSARSTHKQGHRIEAAPKPAQEGSGRDDEGRGSASVARCEAGQERGAEHPGERRNGRGARLLLEREHQTPNDPRVGGSGHDLERIVGRSEHTVTEHGLMR